MPWYAKLERLPRGYSEQADNPVFYIGKEYRVQKHYMPNKVNVYTPNSNLAPLHTMDVGMAQRLFGKPYWRDNELQRS